MASIAKIECVKIEVPDRTGCFRCGYQAKVRRTD